MSRRHWLLWLAWLWTWLGVNAGIGLGWALGDPARTSAAFYQYARQLWPMTTWGIIAVAIATFMAVRPLSMWTWMAGSAYWSFWAVLGTLVAVQPGAAASTFGPLGALGLAASHGATAIALSWRHDRAGVLHAGGSG